MTWPHRRWWCYKSETLTVLRMCHAGGVSDTDGVATVSCGWCCWFCHCYRRVPHFVLLTLAALQMCHAMMFLTLAVPDRRWWRYKCETLAVPDRRWWCYTSETLAVPDRRRWCYKSETLAVPDRRWWCYTSETLAVPDRRWWCYTSVPVVYGIYATDLFGRSLKPKGTQYLLLFPPR
jgi:hypothetical protein